VANIYHRDHLKEAPDDEEGETASGKTVFRAKFQKAFSLTERKKAKAAAKGKREEYEMGSKGKNTTNNNVDEEEGAYIDKGKQPAAWYSSCLISDHARTAISTD
jgi:hypothetical protein